MLEHLPLRELNWQLLSFFPSAEKRNKICLGCAPVFANLDCLIGPLFMGIAEAIHYILTKI